MYDKISVSPGDYFSFIEFCDKGHSAKAWFPKANFDHDNDQFLVKAERLVGKMTARPHNRFVFCVVVVEFAVNGNQA